MRTTVTRGLPVAVPTFSIPISAAPDLAALNCIGFMATYQRGTEWAGTGKVTRDSSPGGRPRPQSK